MIYPKIQTMFKRDPKTNFKTLLNQYSIPEFEYLKDNEWIWTEKIDGTNVRIIWNGKYITYGGRTDRSQIPNILINNLNTIFLPKIEIFKEIFQNNSVTLYGEGYGTGIQEGKYRKDQSFVLFDVFDNRWLKRKDVEDISAKISIDIVPIIGQGTLQEMYDFVKKGFNSKWGDFQAEGIVARPNIDLFSRDGTRIITKLKHNDF